MSKKGSGNGFVRKSEIPRAPQPDIARAPQPDVNAWINAAAENQIDDDSPQPRARKPRRPAEPTKGLYVQVTPEMHQAIKVAAANQELSIREWIAGAVLIRLSQEQDDYFDSQA